MQLTARHRELLEQLAADRWRAALASVAELYGICELEVTVDRRRLRQLHVDDAHAERATWLPRGPLRSPLRLRSLTLDGGERVDALADPERQLTFPLSGTHLDGVKTRSPAELDVELAIAGDAMLPATVADDETVTISADAGPALSGAQIRAHELHAQRVHEQIFCELCQRYLDDNRGLERFAVLMSREFDDVYDFDLTGVQIDEVNGVDLHASPNLHLLMWQDELGDLAELVDFTCAFSGYQRVDVDRSGVSVSEPNR